MTEVSRRRRGKEVERWVTAGRHEHAPGRATCARAPTPAPRALNGAPGRPPRAVSPCAGCIATDGAAGGPESMPAHDGRRAPGGPTRGSATPGPRGPPPATCPSRAQGREARTGVRGLHHHRMSALGDEHVGRLRPTPAPPPHHRCRRARRPPTPSRSPRSRAAHPRAAACTSAARPSGWARRSGARRRSCRPGRGRARPATPCRPGTGRRRPCAELLQSAGIGLPVRRLGRVAQELQHPPLHRLAHHVLPATTAPRVDLLPLQTDDVDEQALREAVLAHHWVARRRPSSVSSRCRSVATATRPSRSMRATVLADRRPALVQPLRDPGAHGDHAFLLQLEDGGWNRHLRGA